MLCKYAEGELLPAFWPEYGRAKAHEQPALKIYEAARIIEASLV
jgi:hypothetical protein